MEININEAGGDEPKKKLTKLVRLKFGDHLVKLNNITGISKECTLDSKDDFVYTLTIYYGGFSVTINYLDEKHRDIDLEHLTNLLLESGVEIL
jgi:hypothetical protein